MKLNCGAKRHHYSMFNVDGLVKSPNPVTPAKAGVQKLLKLLDSGLRRNDDLGEIQTFYETISVGRSMLDVHLRRMGGVN